METLGKPRKTLGKPSETLGKFPKYLPNPQSEFNDNRLDDEQPTLAEAASRVALSSTRSRLFIDCASFDDEAVYTCVAENPFSRVATQTKLSLIKPLLPVGENELAEELASLGELQAAAAAAAAASKRDIDGLATPDNDAKSSLSAVSQCLTQKSRAHNQQGEFNSTTTTTTTTSRACFNYQSTHINFNQSTN